MVHNYVGHQLDHMLTIIEKPMCRNLPFGGRARRPKSWAKAFVSKGEKERSRHQRLFEENVRKTKKTKVCIF